MLTQELRNHFERYGFLRLPGVCREADALRMCERTWAALADRHGIRRDAPDTWTIEQPRHLQSLTRSGAFDAIGSRVLTEAIDDLLGHGTWKRPGHWGQALITFPRRGAEWDVPHSMWHIDWPGRGPSQPLFGVKVLAFLAPVLERGGGTVVIAGSHRLVAERISARAAESSEPSAKLRAALMRESPWLHALGSNNGTADRIGRFMREAATVAGVELRVVELTGAPGDAVLFHPWLFHAPAPNCLTTPRMMVGENLNTASGLARYGGAASAPPG